MKLRTLLGISILSCIGCGTELPTIDIYTPKFGIPVATNGIEINLDKLDNKYEGTTQCLGYGQVDFIVEIMSSVDYFNCGEYSPTGRCRGLYWHERSLIQIPALHNAFAHELAHHFTGGSNDDERVKVCGDGVDGEWNKDE